MNQDAPRQSVSPPVDFTACLRTIRQLAAAISSGPGLVALAGPPGSGKTTNLQLYQRSLIRRRIGYRLPREPMDETVKIDLVDDVRTGDLKVLTGQLPAGLVRVLAIESDMVGRLRALLPSAKIVMGAKMNAADVRALVTARARQSGLGPRGLSDGAIAELTRLNDGTPARIDWLFATAIRHAKAAGAASVTASHVVMAGMTERAMTREGTATPSEAMIAAITANVIGSRPHATRQAAVAPQPVETPAILRPAPLSSLPDMAPAVPIPRPNQPHTTPPDQRTRIFVTVCVLVASAAMLAVTLLPWEGAEQSHDKPEVAVPIASAPAAPQTASVTALPQPDAELAAKFGLSDPVQYFVIHQTRPGARGPASPRMEAKLGENASPRLPKPQEANGASVPRADPAQAARLLKLAEVMQTIGQIDDANHLLRASAALGNADAAQQIGGPARPGP